MMGAVVVFLPEKAGNNLIYSQRRELPNQEDYCSFSGNLSGSESWHIIMMLTLNMRMYLLVDAC